MKFIEGDALQVFAESDEATLFHQVNCQQLMGGGIAKQIRNQYPQHYKDFMDYSKQQDESSLPLLGQYVISGNKPKWIVGLFGQHDVASPTSNGVQTNYAALAHSLFKFFSDFGLYNTNIDMIIPKYIGCGLAGGDWAIVKKLLEDIEKFFGFEFICVELKL